MSTATLRFTRHYAEMVVAMLLGMLVIGMPAGMAAEAAGWGEPQEWAIELQMLGMAGVMTVPMVAWMRVRGHGARPIMEMSAAMFVPALGAIGLGRAGLVGDADALMALEHAAMFTAMLGAMLLRPAEYTCSRHERASA
jgi:hypothetical protein